MHPAWGKINDGQPFHVITVDIDRAISHLGLNRYESMLLQLVRESSWGTSARRKAKGGEWPDPIPCTLNLSELAREWGVKRQRLVEAKASLVMRHILVDPDEPGAYLINKSIEQWNGLSVESYAYCRKALKQDCTPQRAGGERHSVQGCTPERAGGARNSVHFCTPQRSPSQFPPTPPIEEAGARSEERDLIQTLRGETHAHAHARESALFDEDGTATPPIGEPADDALNKQAVALRQIMDAAREAAGMDGERWADRYGFEYTHDVPRVLWAINLAHAKIKAGQPPRGFGGFVKAAFERGPSQAVAGDCRGMTDAERAKAEKQARVAEIYRRRRAERERQESESAGAAALKPGA